MLSWIMPKLNAFGREVPSLAECVNSKRLHGLLLRQLIGILPGQCSRGAQDVAQRLFENTIAEATDEGAACAAQQLLREAGALQHLRGGLVERSSRIFAQIQPHLRGPSVLDYGCGDGEVGRRINEHGYAVSLRDIMDYRSEAARKLPWRLLGDGVEELLPSGDVDSLLLLTVLHHCENPESTFRFLKTLGPRRIITIESVYDLTPDEVFRGTHQEMCSTTDALEWLHLPSDEQFRYACFWDWFYNKVVNSGVVVPYNYSRPDAWQGRLREIGYHEVTRIYLGIDQPLVPEFHVLQVFDADDASRGGAGAGQAGATGTTNRGPTSPPTLS
jgi:SAM-dependent methyltransferase